MIAERFRRRPDVLSRRSLDAVVILPPASDEVLTIAGTGVAVWELLDTWRTVEALTELLATAFGADPGVVAGDLEPLIAEFVDRNVLETAADSGGPAAG